MNSISSDLDKGAVRMLFDIGGKPINGLDLISDGGIYVASYGQTFKKVPYPIQEILDHLDSVKDTRDNKERQSIDGSNESFSVKFIARKQTIVRSMRQINKEQQIFTNTVIKSNN